MNERRPTYGPLPPTWLTHAIYHVVYRAQSHQRECQFSVPAKDALTAAAESLSVIKAATGPHQVTNLQLTISLDV